ncbi:MAG: hypothetical protein KatS3mg118_1026 [Paracoccaceae bacterium]|nr:MAG: hypothetical protein KatS3mg118_1026 [Paracoccaceae bacterium]
MATVFALGLAIFVDVYLVENAWRSHLRGSVSYYPSATPLWMPQAVLAFGWVVLALGLAARAIRLLAGLAPEAGAPPAPPAPPAASAPPVPPAPPGGKSMSAPLGVIALLLALLLGGGVWVGFALMATGALSLELFRTIQVGRFLAGDIWGSATALELVTLPLFILMGEILFHTPPVREPVQRACPLRSAPARTAPACQHPGLHAVRRRCRVLPPPPPRRWAASRSESWMRAAMIMTWPSAAWPAPGRWAS